MGSAMWRISVNHVLVGSSVRRHGDGVTFGSASRAGADRCRIRV